MFQEAAQIVLAGINRAQLSPRCSVRSTLAGRVPRNDQRLRSRSARDPSSRLAILNTSLSDLACLLSNGIFGKFTDCLQLSRIPRNSENSSTFGEHLSES